ncbi:MAG TPA: rhomboid family intramembrane serine protease [Acidobacteriaceae bacterium]
MARSSPITMTFPPFAGTVRKIVLANVAVFFGLAILMWLVPGTPRFVSDYLILHPISAAHGAIWQLATYPFIEVSILGILFGSLTIWFCGSILEGTYGSRWFAELYFTSAIAGAVLASALSFSRVLNLSPGNAAAGAWAGIFGILVAIAVRLGDLEFTLFPIPVRIRAKYMVAIYILIDLALLLKGGDPFSALLHLSGGFCGFLYVRYAPGRGLAFGFSEQYFGVRNAWYRAKRRRAARKFEVYMGKQGRKVEFDKEGRYIDPDQNKDPNDKRWMN